MIKKIKAYYFTIFILFYRLNAGKWPAYMDAELHSGIVGASFVVGMAELSIALILDDSIGHFRLLSKVAVLVGATVTFFANIFIFSRNNVGKKFDHEFRSLDKREQRKMKLAAIVIVAVDIFLLIVSGTYYRHELRIRI